MKGKEKQQGDFLSHAIYDSLIPHDHFVRRLKALLDWQDLASELDDCYRNKGRASVPPQMMLRVVIAQHLYDLSDRQMEEQMTMNIALKYFIGLAPDDTGIDHSTISRFRGRVGNDRFVRIFNKIVQQARSQGLVADRLHAIDSRHFKANVAIWRKHDRDHDDDDTPTGFVKFDDTAGSPDPDAAWGAKSKNFKFLGYKHHISTDVDSGIITETVVTPGNEHDGVVMAQVLDDAARAVVADKAYDLPRNHKLLAEKAIENRIIRKKGDNGTNNTGRWVVEQVNAIVGRWCGGGRARYWGLERVSTQMTLASTAANLKRMLSITANSQPGRAMSAAIQGV